jgi:transposase
LLPQAPDLSSCLPYSPDLNPIEHTFAKLKAALRKAQARTIDGVVQEIARTLPSFSAAECANYFTHAGYASI